MYCSSLTPQQKEYIIGFLLGDSCVERNGRNCRIRFDHSIKQLDYLRWKHRLLCPHSGKLTEYQVIDPRQKKEYQPYQGCRFYTKSNECFNVYFNLFYLHKKKIVPHNISELLTAKGLAAWFLDDGSRKTKSTCLFLHTDGFTLKEVELLQQALKLNFSIGSSLRRTISKNKERPADVGYVLYFSTENAKKIVNIVYPLVEQELPLFQYKLLKPRND